MPTTRSGKTSVAAEAEPAAKKRKIVANDENDSKEKTEEDRQHKNTATTAEKRSISKLAAQPADTHTQTKSRVLEKGLLYYFIRGRVGIDLPKSIKDIARGYLILRPISNDTKLHGVLPAVATARLIAVPKKMLPASPGDRFMAFVEKSNASYDELRESFLKGEDYETKTAGHRHSPDAMPVGEGVCVITTTGRESHLSYMATLPNKLGELQNALRFNEKGSFILSSKNPGYKGPTFARLPNGPDYPRPVLEKFKKLRWVGTQPEFLDYPHAQILLIGQKTGLGKEDLKSEHGEDPADILSRLENDDLDRMQHLSSDESDAIYADLHSRKMAHSGIQKDLGS